MTKKRYRLFGIDLEELSLVDAGANPKALVALAKRKESEMAKKDDMMKEMTEAQRRRFEEEVEKGTPMATAYEKVMGKPFGKSEAEVAVERLEAEAEALNAALKKAGVTVEKSGSEVVVKTPEPEPEPEMIEIDGEKIAKSQVPAPLLKMIENQRSEIDRINKRDEEARFAKRAETEWPNLAGSAVAKGRLMKALEGLDSDDRDAIEKALKAADSAVEFMTKAVGHVEKDENTPMAKLEKMADEHFKKNGGTREAAMAAVTDTPEGRALMVEMRQAAN